MHKSRRGKAQRKGFTEADYARLLNAAHQQLGGPLVVIWDNLNTDVSAAMADLIEARGWLTVCQLPPYAHELNPVEPVWSHLKRSLANLAKRDISQLTALVKPGSDGCSTGPASSKASSPAPAWTSHPSVTPTIRDLLVHGRWLGSSSRMNPGA